MAVKMVRCYHPELNEYADFAEDAVALMGEAGWQATSDADLDAEIADDITRDQALIDSAESPSGGTDLKEQ